VIRTTARLDPDIAATAALIADPSRAAMLSALTDGLALPSGELARIAGVSPATASSHLDKLFKGKLLGVEVQGRHHYYRLRDARIAELLESLSLIARAPAPLTSAQRATALGLRFARTCYGHLAGRLGVAVTQALCAKNYIRDDELGFALTGAGANWFRALGLAADSIQRKPLTRRCLDWSERRHHLAGALGVAWCGRMFELGWLAHGRDSRAVRLTERGKVALLSELDVTMQMKTG
jgi:DNA-binding transcriptional ArsR family regulator